MGSQKKIHDIGELHLISAETKMARARRGVRGNLTLCGCAGLLLCAAPGVWAQSYTISTVAGNGTSGYTGDGGSGTSAELSNGVWGLSLDSSANLYIADQFNNRIRELSAAGTISTVAGDGTSGYEGDGKGAASAEINNALQAIADSSGNLYIADTLNNVIRKVSGGNISTIVGSNSLGAGYAGDGGAALGAQINSPSALALDAKGNLYIADTGNNAIRIVYTNGNIGTFAGDGSAGFGGDGGPADTSVLNRPGALAFDSAGNLYIADTDNNRIRMVSSTGYISTVAGNGQNAFSGDGGPATSASLNYPAGVAIGPTGIIFISDHYNNRIRAVLPGGTIVTIAGNGGTGYSGDGGAATSAEFYFPAGIAVDASGDVFVGDNGNGAVRELKPVAQTPMIGSGGVISASGFGGFSTVAPNSYAEIYGTNLALDSRGWQSSDFTNNVAPTVIDGTTVTIGGQPAFVNYISPDQVNVVVPNVAAGPQPLVLTTPLGTSATYTVNVAATEPGLLAPASFNIGGMQYAVATFPDGTYVLPTGAVAGLTSQPARPGDTIVFYGVGFGAVSPAVTAGEIAPTSTLSNLVAPVTFSFGGIPGTVSFAGLAPGEVDVYQFNVVVPSVAPANAVPVTITVNGPAGTQTLYTAIGS